VKYILDTDICIYLIKSCHPLLLKRFQLVPLGEIGISSITVAELEYGVQKSLSVKQNEKALQHFLSPFVILPFDEKATKHYGKIRADLERKGKIIGGMDLMIAAHVLSLRATLVTNNVKEFERIKKLKIENWVV